MVGVNNKNDLFYVLSGSAEFFLMATLASDGRVYSGGPWRSTALAPSGGNFLVALPVAVTLVIVGDKQID